MGPVKFNSNGSLMTTAETRELTPLLIAKQHSGCRNFAQGNTTILGNTGRRVACVTDYRSANE
jgi:hypothetical protein